MSFDSLCGKLLSDVYAKKYYGGQGLLSKKFFGFEESDYKRSGESAKVMSARAKPSDGTFAEKVHAEVKLGWMCGMERDRRVQAKCLNYSEIVRNNNTLKRTVEARLKHMKKALKDK